MIGLTAGFHRPKPQRLERRPGEPEGLLQATGQPVVSGQHRGQDGANADHRYGRVWKMYELGAGQEAQLGKSEALICSDFVDQEHRPIQRVFDRLFSGKPKAPRLLHWPEERLF
jgi:hypothetical protein